MFPEGAKTSPGRKSKLCKTSVGKVTCVGESTQSAVRWRDRDKQLGLKVGSLSLTLYSAYICSPIHNGD